MKSREPGSNSAWSGSLFQDYRFGILSVGAFSGAINLLLLAGPLYMLQVYDRVLTSKSVPTLLVLTALVLFLFIIVGVLECLRSRILSRIGLSLDESISRKTFIEVMGATGKGASNGNARPVKSLDAVRNFMAGPGPIAFLDAPWVPVYILILFLLHPWLGAFACLGALLLILIAIASDFLTSSMRELAGSQWMQVQDFTSRCEKEAGPLRGLGMFGNVHKHWSGLRDAAISMMSIAGDRTTALSSVSKTIRLFLQSAILGLGAYLAILQEISPGAMIAASIILTRGLAPLEHIISQWSQFQVFRNALQRLAVINRHESASHTPSEMPATLGALKVDKLVVQSMQTSQILLSGISIQLEPGEILGVIGPSGAGKTILSKALIGQAHIVAGSITYNGGAVEQWNAEEFGKQIGYMPHNCEILSGTIAENICRFDENATIKNAMECAQRANIHDMIQSLPKGYNTPLGNEGVNLSAGQKQGLGLARAIYGDPSILIFDDPNAHLDAEGEAALIREMEEAKARGAAVIVITHKPSIIQRTDKLLFLKKGKQCAYGPAQSVMEQVYQPQSVFKSGASKKVSSK